MAIVSSRMEHLWEALCRGYGVLGFARAAKGDEVFRQLVLARIIEPTSKQDGLRVVTEAGYGPASYATVKRRLPGCAEEDFRADLAKECAAFASRAQTSDNGVCVGV